MSAVQAMKTEPAPTPARRWLALIVALGALAVTVQTAWLPTGPTVRGWLGMIWAGLLAATLVVLLFATPSDHRRRHVLRLVAVLASSGVLVVLPSPQLAWVPVVGLVLCAVGDLALRWSITLALIPLVTLVWFSLGEPHRGLTVLQNVLVAVGAFALVTVRRRQREAQELARAQREIIAAELARAERSAAQRVVAAQVHDILAHTLSGLTVSLQVASAQAAREDVSPELRQRLDAASSLAKEGLREARTAVSALRADAAPEPLGSWLTATVARMSAGAELEADIVGRPEDVPATRVELARAVLTEGITNAVRHAAGAPVRIRVGRDGVAVETMSRGRELGHESGGHGLAGLSERAALEGAALRQGPNGHGFLLAVDWTAPTTSASGPASDQPTGGV